MGVPNADIFEQYSYDYDKNSETTKAFYAFVQNKLHFAVKKAAIIPWDAIEEKYAELFPSETGMPAKPLRMALDSLMIQKQYGYSDRELVEQITENPYFAGRFHANISTVIFRKPVRQLLQSFCKGREASLLIFSTTIGIRNTDAGINPCFADIKSAAVKAKILKDNIKTS